MNVICPITLVEALERVRQPDTFALAAGPEAAGVTGRSPATFLDLRNILELKKVEAFPGGYGYYLGAAVTLQQVAELPDLHPVIRRSITNTIPFDEQGFITVAETLFQPRKFPEWLTVLSAWDVGIKMLFKDGSQDARSFAGILQGWDERKLDDGIIMGIQIFDYVDGKRRRGLGSACFSKPSSEYPVVCAGAYLGLNSDGLVEMFYPVVYGITEKPSIKVVSGKLFEGRSFTESSIDTVLKLIRLGVNLSDEGGNSRQRRKWAKTCLRNALMECLAQIKAE